jgi:hypothetical protein
MAGLALSVRDVIGPRLNGNFAANDDGALLSFAGCILGMRVTDEGETIDRY